MIFQQHLHTGGVFQLRLIDFNPRFNELEEQAFSLKEWRDSKVS